MEQGSFDRSIWQNAKWRECGNPYIPRRPTESPLYRIIYQYREEFEYRYDELFEHRFGPLRREVLKAFDAYLNCGIFWHGCARLCCEDCDHSEILAYSCKARNLCASCDAKRAHIFAENVQQNILPELPIRHLIWTIPKRIRPFFKSNRKLRGFLFQAAWQSWRKYCCNVLPKVTDKAKTGAVMSLHPSGALLNSHPHLHSMHVNGLVDTDGKLQPLPEIDTKLLEKRFAEKLFDSLIHAEVIDQELPESMQAWQHSGFNVHAGEPIEHEDENSRLFIARYLVKCPIALNKIELIEQPLQTTVRYYKEVDDQSQYQDFSPLEFLATISCNIPGTWEQLVRYYGVCSPRTRGAASRDILVLKSVASLQSPEKLRTISSTLEQNEQLKTRKPISRQWAIWIRKVYEVDPLECPKCKGRMKIKAFIHDPRQIKRICQHLGIQAWQAPKPLQPP